MVGLTSPASAGAVVTVGVSGDVRMDLNLACVPAGSSEREKDTSASWQRGGAALLADLLQAVTAGGDGDRPSVEIRGPQATQAPIPQRDDALNHSYALWSKFQRGEGPKKDEPTWRVASFLGVDRARTADGVRSEWDRLARDLPECDVIVLDDDALGFRDQSSAALWQRAMAGGHRPWVILKAAKPVTDGLLWKHLLAELPDRLLVVLGVDDFRSTEVQVSRALSWERTAQDLFWEIAHKPAVNALSRIAHTVVSFGPAGSLLVSGPRGGSEMPTCTLFFDPELTEGTWETGHAGSIMGATDCLVAALAREFILDPAHPNLARGVQAGAAAGRRLHLDGYQERGPGHIELAFPLAAVAEEIRSGHEVLQRVDVPDPAAPDGYWTILQDRCTGDLAAPAAEIVTHGPKQALKGIPVARFGALVTADRSEIEAFRSIGTLIGEYVASSQAKPLSIGVFGPPGAGKSFGVREVARSVAPGRIGEPLEFNLAEFRSPDELIDALHRVRDTSLAGGVPLVFWDEFDASLDGQPLGWLRYFLAPMQDGKFRQGQLTHPIGKAVFVFAGGTCPRLTEFGSGLPAAAFREAKGPDFVSRLKGYVDVLGPNPHGTADPYHVIRRAILLQSVLARRAGQIFDGTTARIDPGVLRAFLETSHYRHGTRSMENIVTTSLLAGKSAYERSSLPTEAELDLYVDARDFLSRVQHLDVKGDLLERLAEAAHEEYCDDLRARGYTWGEVSDEKQKINSSLVDYQELDEGAKEQNRRNVRDIPAKLELVGCVMVPARADTGPFAFTHAEVEILSREEHERFMRDLGPGWCYGKPTDKARKFHEAYLPWAVLPEEQRDKDRNLVLGILAIIRKAGYTVARTRPAAVAVGVTGHRALGELDRLEAGMKEASRVLEDTFRGPWTVISALAEGADRLVARRLLAREGTRLVAVLPLAPGDYAADFADEASRREFTELLARADDVISIPDQAGRDEAYDAAGREVLDRADVLVTVWDGLDAQGRGGTGDVVSQARQRGLPLAWVHAGNREPGTLEPTSLGTGQGEVTYERLPKGNAAVPG